MEDNWLYDLVEWCVREGREDAQNWITYTQGSARNLSRDDLATRVVHQQAQLAARAPVTPAAVGSLPGIRTAVNRRLISADVGFLLYRMIKSIMYQAAAYGQRFDKDGLPERVLLILGVALGDDRTRTTLVAEGNKPPAKLLERIVRGGAKPYAQHLGEIICHRFHGKGSLSSIPIVGRPYFGAQNFIFISAAALAGRYVFNDCALSKKELDELDARVLDLSRAVLSLMVWMAKGDGSLDRSEADTIMMLEESLLMPGISYEELEKDLPETPDWDRIRRQFQTEDEKAGLLENILMVVWADGEKQPSEDRMCRRLAAELVADRMIDDIETAVKASMRSD